MSGSIAINILQTIGLLIAFGAVLFLVVITTKFVGGKASKAMKGKHINLIESVSLGVDKNLHLIRVGEKFILVASSGKNIEFISDVKLDNYNIQETTENEGVFDFKSIFDKYLQNFNRKKVNGSVVNIKNNEASDTAEGDRFKSNLNRLRTINTETDRQGKENGDGH